MSETAMDEFYKQAKSADMVWIGEIHGIRENYILYQSLIPSLRKIGYALVALEYPQDLNPLQKANWYKYLKYQDGRFSQDAFNFFQWLVSNQISFRCFDTEVTDQQNREYTMAESLIKYSSGAKTLVISGGFHSQKKPQKVNGQLVLPQSGVVEQVTKNYIVRLGIKYLGGRFVNFGIKDLTVNFSNYDDLKLTSGEFSRNINPLLDEQWWIHAGPATPVTLL